MGFTNRFRGIVAVGLLLAIVSTTAAKYSGGTGEPNDPYQIATAVDLIALGETVADYGKHFILTADIDLDPSLPSRKVFTKAVIAPAQFSPTDVEGTPFVGVFDGAGHTIAHLTIKGNDFLGLLGYLASGAEIRNLGVVDVSIVSSGLRLGALAAMSGNLDPRLDPGAAGTVLTDCWSTGVVSGGTFVGGLIGWNSQGRVTSCYSTAAVSGTWDVGGLVGSNIVEGTVSDSYSSGTVHGKGHVGGLAGSNTCSVKQCYSTSAVTGSERIGGLIGTNGADGWTGGEVTECHSTGKVAGTSTVGGLIGLNGSTSPYPMWRGTVARCYSTAVVGGTSKVGGLVGDNGGRVTQCYSASAVDGNDYVGGLTGSNGPNTNPGFIAQCYSTGAVKGAGPFVGGLVGYQPPDGCAGACFWDTQTSGQTSSAGGTGKTTAEMQMAKTFLDAGWDFVGETANGTEDIWWIFEGRDYPKLWWERVLGDDFQDGKAEPLWMAYELEPQRVRLKEVNGRLEVEAVAQEEDIDSIYVANGWRLDASKSFALRVDFHFSKSGVGDGRVTLGVVPSLDPSGMRWAELEAGCFDTEPFYLYEVRDGFWVQERVTDRSSEGGTLYMSYDPNTDELYFSHTGYGKANAWQTVPGLLKGRWASEAVYVTLSGGSEGMALEPGDAWLDDFIISSGTLVSSEPDDAGSPDD